MENRIPMPAQWTKEEPVSQSVFAFTPPPWDDDKVIPIRRPPRKRPGGKRSARPKEVQTSFYAPPELLNEFKGLVLDAQAQAGRYVPQKDYMCHLLEELRDDKKLQKRVLRRIKGV